MALTFRCPCGLDLEIDDQYAGMQVQCPTCQGLVTAPKRGPKMAMPVRRPTPPPPAGSTRSRVTDDADDRPTQRVRLIDEDDEDRPRRRRRVEDEEDAEERPRKRSRKKKGADKPKSLEGKVLNGGVVGGGIAMLIAVVWFVGGLFADIIFFYPPILFVLGMIGVAKGMLSSQSE